MVWVGVWGVGLKVGVGSWVDGLGGVAVCVGVKGEVGVGGVGG